MPKPIEDIKPASKPKSRPVAPLAEAIPKKRPPQTQAPAPRIVPREIPFEPVEPRQAGKHGLWYIAAGCIIALLFSLSYFFEHANVTITPKSLPVAFDASDTYTAQKDSTDSTVVTYTVMTLAGDESMKLPSTDSKTQSLPAKGTVILYNAYSPAPYKLVKNTRLATPDGKIYRLDGAVTIPGYTKDGTSIVPGSVQAAATAAQPGDAYNVDHADFVLPGLSGSPQYKSIYGRSPDGMSGGMSGLIYSVPADAANAALGTLEDKLKTSLLAKAKVQVPDGYIFYGGATKFTTDQNVQAPYSTTPDVPLALHGTLSAYLIKEDTLVSAIAAKTISQYNGEAVTVPGIETLDVVPTGPLNPGTDTSFTFSLSGSAKIVWTVDTAGVQKALAGTKKSDFPNIMAAMPGVDQAEMVLKPFWKQSFPDDASRISVTVQKP